MVLTLARAQHVIQTTRIALLDWFSQSPGALSCIYSELLRFRSMPCGGKMVFGSASPIHIGLWIQGPVWRAPVCYCRKCRQVFLPMTKIMTLWGESLQKSVHKATKKQKQKQKQKNPCFTGGQTSQVRSVGQSFFNLSF